MLIRNQIGQRYALRLPAGRCRQSGIETLGRSHIVNAYDRFGVSYQIPADRQRVYQLRRVGPGEIYLAVERGTLDGAEFSSPGVDWEMGFAEITKYWSVPGWHQPCAQVGMMVNKNAWNKLPKLYQKILTRAAMAAAMESLTFYEADSARAIEKFKAKGTKIVHLTPECLKTLDELTGKYILKALHERGANSLFAKILKSQMEYLKTYRDWRDMTDVFGHGETPSYVDAVLAELEKMGVK